MGLGMSGGLTNQAFTPVSGASAVVTQLTPQATQLCFVSAGTTAGAPRYLKFYDTAVAQAGGGNVAIGQMIIPANPTGAGTNLAISPGPPAIGGAQFTTGLAFAVTANQALTDNSGIQGDTTVWLGWR